MPTAAKASSSLLPLRWCRSCGKGDKIPPGGMCCFHTVLSSKEQGLGWYPYHKSRALIQVYHCETTPVLWFLMEIPHFEDRSFYWKWYTISWQQAFISALSWSHNPKTEASDFSPIFCGNLSLFYFWTSQNGGILHLGCLESQAVGMRPYLVIPAWVQKQLQTTVREGNFGGKIDSARLVASCTLRKREWTETEFWGTKTRIC